MRRTKFTVTDSRRGLSEQLNGSSAKSPDTGHGGHTGGALRPVPPPVAPDERVPVGVPVTGRPLHGRLDLRPRLEPPVLEGQRPQHLPPRLDQVPVTVVP